MSALKGTRPVRLCLGAAVVVVGCYGVATAATLLAGLHGLGQLVAAGLLTSCLAAGSGWFLLAGSASAPRAGPADPPALTEAERLTRRLDFDRQVDRALERAHSESDLFALAARALGSMWPDAPAEVLMVAGTGQRGRPAPLLQVAEAGPDGEGPGCPVARPEQCEAIHRNRTLRWRSSDDLDVCPFLAHREERARSAVCIPIRIVGNPAGVLHRTAAAADPAQEFDVAALESLAGRIEARLSMVHLSPGEVDLPDANGVFDRAALDRRINALLRSLSPFALARCDVEDLAGYGDRHGEQAASEALRCFERTMVGCLRPDDTVGRVGPHELVAVLPGATIGDARRVLDRVREELVLQLNERRLAPLRVASGAVESHGRHGRHGLDELLDAVDAAVISRGGPAAGD